MRGGQRVQPRLVGGHCLRAAGHVAKSLLGQALDHGQRILHPVVQLHNQQVLSRRVLGLLSDVVPLDDDPGRLATFAFADRLEDEIENALVMGRVVISLEDHWLAPAEIRFASAIDLVEYLDESLSDHFRHGLRNALAEKVGPPDQLQIGGIGHLKHVRRAGQYRDEAGRLAEEFEQLLAFAL